MDRTGRRETGTGHQGQGRDQAEGQGRDDAQGRCHREEPRTAPVGCHDRVREEERTYRGASPPREGQCHGGREDRHDRRLDEQFAKQSRSGGAKRSLQGELTAAPKTTGKEQVAHVAARDQQHQH